MRRAPGDPCPAAPESLVPLEPWVPATVVVVVVAPFAADVVAEAPVLGPDATALVVAVTGARPGLVLTVVGGDDNVVVVVEGAGDEAGAMPAVETPGQIVAKDAVLEGGGSLLLAGSSVWNRRPRTSPGGLDTDCSAGPLFAYTHDPVVPCQYDQ